MKIYNETDWETRDLQKIFRLCLKNTGYPVRGRMVDVIYSKNRWNSVHGWGSYGRRYIKMALPRENINVKDMAQVFIHEAGHNAGLHHCDMLPVSKINVSFLNGETVQKKIPREKPKIDPKQVRYLNVQSHVKEAESKVKRWQNILKKWKKKEKYYQKSFQI